LWPLLGLDTPPKFFWHIKMAVHIWYGSISSAK
jgi:hypothetical protein